MSQGKKLPGADEQRRGHAQHVHKTLNPTGVKLRTLQRRYKKYCSDRQAYPQGVGEEGRGAANRLFDVETERQMAIDITKWYTHHQ